MHARIHTYTYRGYFTHYGTFTHVVMISLSFVNIQSFTTYRKKLHNVTLEDPGCGHHLWWLSPPDTVLIMKKFKDPEVTKKFKELCSWIVEVLYCTFLCDSIYHHWRFVLFHWKCINSLIIYYNNSIMDVLAEAQTCCCRLICCPKGSTVQLFAVVIQLNPNSYSYTSIHSGRMDVLHDGNPCTYSLIDLLFTTLVLMLIGK